MAGVDKTTEDQVREIRKLVADAEDVLAQVTRALRSLEERLAEARSSADP